MATWSTPFPDRFYVDGPELQEMPLKELKFGEAPGFGGDEMFDDEDEPIASNGEDARSVWIDV